MKSKDKLIVLVALMVVVVAGAALVYNSLIKDYSVDRLSETTNETVTGEGQTPDFKVTDVSGKRITLSSMKGKPVVVNFWASWCYYCKEEMPDFQKAYDELGKEVTFMMVNMTDNAQEPKATAEAYIKEKGYTFPVYFDEEQSAAINFQATSLPATYFFDKDGKLVTYANGMIDYETLIKGITMIK